MLPPPGDGGVPGTAGEPGSHGSLGVTRPHGGGPRADPPLEGSPSLPPPPPPGCPFGPLSRNLSKACLSLKSQAACHLPNGLRSMRPGGRPSHFITDAAGQGRSSRGAHGSLRGLTPAPSPPGGNSSICSSHAETRACPAEDKDSRAPRGARESASGLVWGQQKVPVPRRRGCCSTWGVGRPKPRRWRERSPPRAPDCSATRRRLSQGPRQEVVPPTVCPLGPTQRVAVTCVPRC